MPTTPALSTFDTRPATHSDIPVLTRMLDSCSRRYLDRPTEPDEVADRLATPGSDPRHDSLRSAASPGSIPTRAAAE